MSDINIHGVPTADIHYTLTNKKIMCHDLAAPLGSSTVLINANQFASNTFLSDFWGTTFGNAYIDGVSSEHGYTLVSTDVILSVFVEGLQFNIVAAAPGNRQCQLDLANNKIIFQDTFDGTQTVNVLFKR